MNGLKIAPLVIIAAALSGCGRSGLLGGGADKPPKVTRPIMVVLVTNNGNQQCEPKYSKKPTHAFPDDTIAWQVINTCQSDKNVTLDVKNGSSNPFKTPNPWNTSVPMNNGDNPAEIDLVVKSDVQTGTYSFTISVDGRSFDPKLEIDPYK